MTLTSKFHSLIVCMALTLSSGSWTPLAWSQELNDTGTNQEAVVPQVMVQKLQIGAHPDLTRIEVTLDGETGYEVIPDFKRKKISLYIKDAGKNPLVQPLVFHDRFLERVDITSLENTVKLTFRLKNQNTRLFHFFRTTRHG